jgi:uncharacterized protein YbjT (DUF2867 family)
MKLFITGATGNVGRAIIAAIDSSEDTIYAGVRNPSKINTDPFYKKVTPVTFDFSDLSNSPIPEDIDVLFLMRPPQIADPVTFGMFLNQCVSHKPHIIFLSIQNAEQKEFTPHRKIEHKIIESGLPYTFIRPSYFMDNITTTLYDEIKKNHRIYMPSGNLKFNWIDVADIGSLTVHIARNHQDFVNKALEITGIETTGFSEVVSIINRIAGCNIQYKSPTIITFFIYSIKHKIPMPFILVLILLHWIPKFEKPPVATEVFKNIMGRKPGTIENFIISNLSKFRNI